MSPISMSSFSLCRSWNVSTFLRTSHQHKMLAHNKNERNRITRIILLNKSEGFFWNSPPPPSPHPSLKLSISGQPYTWFTVYRGGGGNRCNSPKTVSSNLICTLLTLFIAFIGMAISIYLGHFPSVQLSKKRMSVYTERENIMAEDLFHKQFGSSLTHALSIRPARDYDV